MTATTEHYYTSLKSDYDRNGYVIIPAGPAGLIPSLQTFEDLQSTCERVISKTRSGEWSHRRTVGKQFPPYGEANPDSWGVQHLMNPELGEKIFAEWYCSENIIQVVKALVGCENEEDLQLELFNLLINPVSHKFALRWHRDDVREDASEANEMEALAKWHSGVQWNTALYRDDCLFVVPGSHISPRTSEQRKHSSTLLPPDNPLDMPGAIQVTLEPGDTVFYNSNILHCAVYSPSSKRATLHACMGDAVRGGEARARNILQHDLGWMKNPNFRKTLPSEDARRMLDRLLALRRASEISGRTELVYSLSG